jgi:hypothetical protein
MGAKRSRGELIRLLEEQRQALAASCENYDRGNHWEAARLATIVHTLVHDGGAITSLLTQLGLRASLRFVSSNRIRHNPNRLVSSPPLVTMQISSDTGAKFVPRLADQNGAEGRLELQFERWWAKELIFKDLRAELTRRRLVFGLRHQDGGSHVGALTDPAYVWLKDGAGWFGGIGTGAPEAVRGAVAATMRQVAWEVTETLGQLGELS